MDYEKKYKEVLGHAKRAIENIPDESLANWLKNIFPELKESEDEKIRKAIVAFFECQDDNTTYSFVTKQSILAWLERQREQKPTDIELRFKVGDWVVNKFGYVWHVDSFDKKNYQVSNNKDLEDCYFKISDQDQFHLWTIADAKDGDVLCAYECDEPKIVFILKGTYKGYAIKYHCFYNIKYPKFDDASEPGNLGLYDEEKKDFRPATKEQRNLLFQKMKEAGYEWDDIEKLKKI